MLILEDKNNRHSFFGCYLALHWKSRKINMSQTCEIAGPGYLCGVMACHCGCVSSSQNPETWVWRRGKQWHGYEESFPKEKERMVSFSVFNKHAWLLNTFPTFYQNGCNFRTVWLHCPSMHSCWESRLIQTSV